MPKFWKAEMPKSDFYAVLFISTRSKNLEGYADMDEKTIEKVKELDGFLGYESIKNGDDGIFISYWANMESIEKWKNDSLHMEAKSLGYAKWYDRLVTQICKVNYSKEFIR
jgi:heme-degrading monooxygenase HmoA